MLHHRLHDIHTGDQEIVSLKLIAIRRLHRAECPVLPVLSRLRKVRDRKELPIKQSAAGRNFDFFPRRYIIALGQIGCLSAGDFQTPAVHIPLPARCLMSLLLQKERIQILPHVRLHLFYAEPVSIERVIHEITDPARREDFPMPPRAARLLLRRLPRPRFHKRNLRKLDFPPASIRFALRLIGIRSPENMASRGLVREQLLHESHRRELSDILLYIDQRLTSCLFLTV